MPLNSAPVPEEPARAAKPLVIATGNPGKLREFRAFLADLPFDLRDLAELQIGSPAETGASFFENAMLKARHAAAAAAAVLQGAGAGAGAGGGGEAPGVAAIADDSGLEVDALNGAPGLLSARYAGPGGDDAANNAKLLKALAGVPPDRRQARYRCALVFVDGAQDCAPLVAEGVWEGRILDVPRGSGGFGYDPYFFLPGLRKTAAELDPWTKNRLSHRGRAVRALREQLAQREQPAASEPLAVRGPPAPRA